MCRSVLRPVARTSTLDGSNGKAHVSTQCPVPYDPRQMPSWDGPRILKAKSEGKLVVTDGHSYIYYGREANEWAKQWRNR